MSASQGAGESSPASDVLIAWVVQVARRILETGWHGIALATIGASIGVVIALLLPLEFTATANFIAQGSATSQLPAALQGIASSVGLATAKDYSPQFYADLVTSQTVLEAALSQSYIVSERKKTVPTTYYDLENITGRDSATRLDAATRHLRKRVSTRADVRTNIISIGVTARYPSLSRDLARSILEALDSLNIGFRQQQSRELRHFFETRAEEAQRDLDSAETLLRRFLERNRVTQGSPLLLFEEARLTRTVDLKRSVYTTVVQQYEQAKLQESRNVPVLTILTPPSTPVRKSGPPRRFIVVVGLLLGLVVAVTKGYVASLLKSVLTPRVP